RLVLGAALEVEPPCAEEILALVGGVRTETEQGCEARLDPGALLRVRDVGSDPLGQLPPGRARLLALGDVGAGANHLRERPEGDSLAVGEAAAAPPEDRVDEAVDALLVLPGEA